VHPLNRIAWAILWTALALPARAADVAIVVSAKSPQLALSKEQVAAIFLGKTVRFPDGRRAVPIDHSEGVAIRNQFYESFTGKSAAQLKAHWAKIIFTGRGRPPRQVPGGEEAKRQLALNPDAIAYLDAALVDASVRVVSVPAREN
jgi:ABC-type phosphate transport system substrate-binding protein